MSLTNVSLNKIKLAKNSRMDVKAEEIAGLMQSIKSTGLLEPIGIMKAKKGYEILYGNRRFLAYSKLGRKTIPAMIFNPLKQSEKDIMNLTENVQRRGLGLVEVGRYCQLLMKEGLTKNEIAVRLGVSKNYIENCVISFRKVPPEFRKHVAENRGGFLKKPGDINLSAVKKLSTVSTSYRLTAAQKKNLYKAAQSKDFIPEKTGEYAKAIKSGHSNPLKKVQSSRVFSVKLYISDREYDRVYDKHITEGPFHSMSEVIANVLSGKKREIIKCKS
jgi:ParB/RepB/Spo0J family partition protein